MKSTARFAALALALPFALAACSDSAEEPAETTTVQTSEETTSEETTEATDESSEGADTEPTDDTTSADETEPAEETEAPAADAEKVSKDEMKAGLEKMMEEMGYSRSTFEEAGLSGEQIDGYYTCIVDGTYEEISATFVNAIAAVDPNATVSPEDTEKFNAAVGVCAEDLTPAE